jgi:hypothetical protein
MFVDIMGNLSLMKDGINMEMKEYTQWFEDELKIVNEMNGIKVNQILSCGKIIALLTDEHLYLRGMNANGTFVYDNKFVCIDMFTGHITTSLDYSTVSHVSVDIDRVIIIMKNGCVFVLGNQSEFSHYKSNLPSRGVVEITDKENFSPMFISHFVDDHLVDDVENKYGVFGPYKVSSYHPQMKCFLTDEGVPLIKVYG